MTAQELIDLLENVDPDATIRVNLYGDVGYDVDSGMASINEDDTEDVTLFIGS
jgi:hypothetical protein